jgi:hypothetical protein|uniref:Uncharacterized protein n=1 Tax=Leviviridae sp. TaxID=2027243 RepID=A0A514D8I8_9VIRU|nr:MAG: hypothetical protein H2Bulk353126_000003 [Leviviridae sp.]
MTTLTLTDAAGTPVNRSFPLVSSTPDLSVWKDFATNSGVPQGAGVATLSLKENSNGTMRLTGKLVLPSMETLSGATYATKAFECLGSFDLVFPSRTSLQNRKDLKAMFIDFLSDALVTSAVESFVHPV